MAISIFSDRLFSMDELSRILGKLEKHAETTSADIATMKTTLEEIKQFRWKIAGMTAVLSVFSTVGFNLVILAVQKGIL
jgi:predicted transcriptional regulator